MVVMPPVNDGSERSARGEKTGRSEQRHEGHEAAVGATVDTDPVAIHVVVLHQEIHAIGKILELRIPHVAIDGRSPVAPITFGRAVIHIDDDIAVLRQQRVKHELAKIIRPAQVRILGVSGAVYEHHGRVFLVCVVIDGQVKLRINWPVHMARWHFDDLGYDPVDGLVLFRNRVGQPQRFGARLGVLHEKVRVAVDGRVRDQQASSVG